MNLVNFYNINIENECNIYKRWYENNIEDLYVLLILFCGWSF